MNTIFHNGFFQSEKGEVIEAKLRNGILVSKLSSDEKFIEFMSEENGWSFGGQSYSIKPFGDDILVARTFDLSMNEIFKRI